VEISRDLVIKSARGYGGGGSAGVDLGGGNWPMPAELSKRPGNTSLDLPHCSPVEEASPSPSVCGAFLCFNAALSTRELVTPYSRFVFGRGRGFQLAPSRRGSLVSVMVSSARLPLSLPLSPLRCVLTAPESSSK
jgi:hypothetical protein